MYILKEELLNLIETGQLMILPLLDKGQIGELTIDLRLGYNFLVSIHGRNPFLDASHNHEDRFSIRSSFQETRRLLGETFILHPQQTILGSSLEYMKLPKDIFAELSLRSSYLRLGISISAIVQSGYCGCFSIELTNTNHTAINLTIGAPLFQARFYRIAKEQNYFSKKRKYMCQVRPLLSAVNADHDLKILQEVYKERYHKP